MPLIDVKVTVTGPGGVIVVEGEIIRRALEAHGIKVVVSNYIMGQPMADYDAQDNSAMKLPTDRDIEAALILNHVPWGG
jgi:hypothetical protein